MIYTRQCEQCGAEVHVVSRERQAGATWVFVSAGLLLALMSLGFYVLALRETLHRAQMAAASAEQLPLGVVPSVWQWPEVTLVVLYVLALVIAFWGGIKRSHHGECNKSGALACESESK